MEEETTASPSPHRWKEGQAVPKHLGLLTPGWSFALAPCRPLQSGHLSQEETTGAGPAGRWQGGRRTEWELGGRIGSREAGEGTHMAHSTHIHDLRPSCS